jgi:hypothetical protein
MRLPSQGSLFVRQLHKFIDFRVCCQMAATKHMGKRRVQQCVHQGGSLPDFTRVLERVLGVCERVQRITKHP